MRQSNRVFFTQRTQRASAATKLGGISMTRKKDNPSLGYKGVTADGAESILRERLSNIVFICVHLRHLRSENARNASRRKSWRVEGAAIAPRTLMERASGVRDGAPIGADFPIHREAITAAAPLA